MTEQKVINFSWFFTFFFIRSVSREIKFIFIIDNVSRKEKHSKEDRKKTAADRMLGASLHF